MCFGGNARQNLVDEINLVGFLVNTKLELGIRLHRMLSATLLHDDHGLVRELRSPSPVRSSRELNLVGEIMTGDKGTNNDDAAFFGVRSPCVVACEGQLLDARGVLIAHDLPRLIRGDVDILLPELCLGGWRVYGLRKPLAARESPRLRQAVNCLRLLVPVRRESGG